MAAACAYLYLPARFMLPLSSSSTATAISKPFLAGRFLVNIFWSRRYRCFVSIRLPSAYPGMVWGYFRLCSSRHSCCCNLLESGSKGAAIFLYSSRISCVMTDARCIVISIWLCRAPRSIFCTDSLSAATRCFSSVSVATWSKILWIAALLLCGKYALSYSICPVPVIFLSRSISSKLNIPCSTGRVSPTGTSVKGPYSVSVRTDDVSLDWRLGKKCAQSFSGFANGQRCTSSMAAASVRSESVPTMLFCAVSRQGESACAQGCDAGSLPSSSLPNFV